MEEFLPEGYHFHNCSLWVITDWQRLRIFILQIWISYGQICILTWLWYFHVCISTSFDSLTFSSLSIYALVVRYHRITYKAAIDPILEYCIGREPVMLFAEKSLIRQRANNQWNSYSVCSFVNALSSTGRCPVKRLLPKSLKTVILDLSMKNRTILPDRSYYSSWQEWCRSICC